MSAYDSPSRLEDLFVRALDLPADGRAAFVAAECPDDPALRLRVLDLLAQHDTGSGLLDVPLSALVAPLLAEDAASAEGIAPGTRVGPYRIVRLLGRGGMGSVYLAERADGAFQQSVALKVVNAGLLTQELERRFLHERQILAALDHPGIARLLHGGLTNDGHPWLAMQLVEGKPITEWAESRSLPVSARLRLFLQVCDAVHYAHRRLIVHRDLKPSNILVTDAGEVRLLDFGIARLMSGDEDAASPTRTGLLLLTPEYAAPELLEGGLVTMSTDVYSLGIVLYELLAGSRPFRSDVRSFADLLRQAEQDAPPLGKAPGLDPARRRLLAGDLEAIVATALHRQPERRYDSVEALADDVRAHLERRPVSAHADSRAYRLGRFVRRHTVGVAAGLAVVVSVFAGLIATTRMATVARQEAARSEAVRSFLFSLWEGTDPGLNRGDVPTARDLLDRAVPRIDSLSPDVGPEVRADMLTTLGFLYGKLGEYERAAGIFERAVTETRAAFGVDERTGTALDGLAQNLFEAGDGEGAEAAARESLRIRRAAGSPDTALAGSYTTLGVLLNARGAYEEAEEMHLAALDLDRRGAGPGSLAVATDLSNLGAVVRRLGRHEQAVDYHRRALDIRRERLGELHPVVAISLGHLSGLHRDMGDYAQAEALARRSLEIRRTVLGRDHPDVAISLDDLSQTVSAAGRNEEADSLAVEALELRRRVFGERHPSTLTSMNNLAIVRFRRGAYAWAADVQEQVAAIWREELGLGDQRATTALHNLGVMRLRAGNTAAAEQPMVEALEARRALLGTDHVTFATSLRWVSELRRAEGRYAEAEALAEQALAVFVDHLPAGHPRIAEANLSLGAARLESGATERAIEPLREALAAREAAAVDDPLPVAEAQVWLGAALIRSGRTEEGVPLLQSALSAYHAAGRDTDPEAARARRELARH